VSASTPRVVQSSDAPPPAEPYSQAVACGNWVFISGQTPREPGGRRLLDRPFEEQVERTLQNLDVLARAAGGSLKDAVKVNVFLRPGADVAAFNAIYERYFHTPYPARTTTVSDLSVGMLEVDAVLYMTEGG